MASPHLALCEGGSGGDHDDAIGLPASRWNGRVTSKEFLMTYMQYLKRFLRDEDGVTAIEYGLIAALIAVVIIGAVEAVGGGVSGVFNAVSAELTGALPAAPAE
jgi:pilus assembly protein Flp/PilA